MVVTYKKLFHLMIDRGISSTKLIKQAGFSANIITRLKRDNCLSLNMIKKICRTLNCGVDDILEFTPGIKKIRGNTRGQFISAETTEDA